MWRGETYSAATTPRPVGHNLAAERFLARDGAVLLGCVLLGRLSRVDCADHRCSFWGRAVSRLGDSFDLPISYVPTISMPPFVMITALAPAALTLSSIRHSVRRSFISARE